MAARVLGVNGETLQVEMSEWENINRMLKRHGCSAVAVSAQGGSGGVLLDSQSSVALRSAIGSLVEDTERRQNLIQGLIQSNNQLKEDLRLQQERAGRQEQRANELQRILDDVKTKICNLEDDFITKMRQQQAEMARVLQEKSVGHERWQKQNEKLQEQEEHIAQLKQRLSQATAAEEKRAANQKKAFLRLMNREPRDNIILDQQILDVIDGYERRVSQLQSELRAYKSMTDPMPLRKSSDASLDLDTTPNYKALVKSYQEQIKEARRKNEELLRENQQTKQEMESRPTVKEFRLYKQQMRKMEKILLQNIRVRGVKQDKKPEPEISMDQTSTDVKHLDLLPATECQRHLQDVCREMSIEDLKDLVPAVRSTLRRAEACTKLHKVLSDIHAVISGPRAPQLLYKPHSRASENPGKEDLPDEADFIHLLPTVELWAGQLLSLKALHRALRKLSEKLLPDQIPEKTQDGTDGVRVEELLLLVDTMMEDVENRKQDSGRVSAVTLQALVSHFQKLFDVPSLAGVFPRMNEVYSKLGEATNAMKNLRSLLGLGAGAGSGAVVNAVWRLCRDTEEGSGDGKLQEVLGPLDIDSIINKLQEHEEFFPAFEGLVKALLDALEISQLEEILPEVHRLKALDSR